MYAGQIIPYRIRVFGIIPFNWVTEITHCQQSEYFIDEQRFGPYRFWHHQHRFTETDSGILMEDIIHYALPMGWLGRIIAGTLIKKKVEGIFAFRESRLEKLFSQKQLTT